MKTAHAPVELWGGLECPFNRVNDSYLDQLKFNGQEERISDLELFAELGFKTLRYPFLWEKIFPNKSEANWGWAEKRLAKLKEVGINPIAGLLHHGSGPRTTSLLDPDFPEKLAQYARNFA